MKDRTEEVWARVVEELGERDHPARLREYVDELSRWGEKIHLTGREKMADAIATQVSDSMIMLELAGEGPVVADIINTAEKHAVDLVIIASHGRSGLGRVFFGSVAAGVLNRIEKPLMVIRSTEAK